MKVLVISISAPPKNSPESLQTGKYVKQLTRKCDVSLLTTKPEAGWAPPEKELEKYLKDVKHVTQLPNPPRLIRFLLKRIFASKLNPDDHAYFHWQSHGKAVVKEMPDIIFSRSTPFSSAVMALKLARAINKPWVMHLSDLWVDNPFYNRAGSLKQVDAQWEESCFKQASYITVTSNRTLSFYQQKYPSLSGKMHLLPNVVDSEQINTMDVSFRKKLRFLFTGRMYGTRSPEPFLNAFKIAVQHEPKLLAESEVVFAGFADDNSLGMLKDSKLANLTYFGHVSQQRATELQQNAHVLILIDSLADDERYDNFFPSKLLEYFAANRKVIAITRSTSSTAELITEREGAHFSKENIDLLPFFIIRCFKEYKAENAGFFRSSDIARQFTSDLHAERLVRLFHTLL